MTYHDDVLDERWRLVSERIRLRDHSCCQECGAVTNLEVHHTYYRNGWRLWDYPDTSLITYCKKCHIEAHAQGIPIFDRRGRLVRIIFGHADRCPRCCGTGTIPPFSHVCEGICFLCWGLQYWPPDFSRSKTVAIEHDVSTLVVTSAKDLDPAAAQRFSALAPPVAKPKHRL